MARETEDLALDEATLRAGVAGAARRSGARSQFRRWKSDGEAAASLMLTTEWSEWRNGFFWWIQSVYVRPSQRGRGHYRRLHEQVRALAAREPEVCGLRLYVERENTGAQATYRALGMFETHYLLFEESTRS